MINFVKYKFIAPMVSFFMILGIVGVIIYRVQTTGQAFNYSIDFTGGSQFVFKFEKPVSSDQILSVLKKKNFKSPETREFSQNEVLVKVQEYTTDVSALAKSVSETIKAEFPDNKIEVLQSDSIGAGIGLELRKKSMTALLIALVLLLFYIIIRFLSFGLRLGFGFALGAVLSLFHDAMMMLGVFLIFNKEISLNIIGAILAILGYSINDTIVIFSQIRKNIPKMTSAPIAEIVNVSVNQTLRRTILTSFSTALTVLSLFFLGGEVLRNISLALLVGIVFGTYSTIYIASPIMMLFYKKEDIVL